ncbi:MAG: hypothetical protein ACOC9Q_03680 [bacterium]
MAGKLIVRPATREDIEAFSEEAGKPTIRAWVGDLDGEIVAIGGFARIRGRWFGFCDLTDDARPYKMTLMRAAHRAMKAAREQGIRFIYADADRSEPRAMHWLHSLGFEPLANSSIHRWRA